MRNYLSQAKHNEDFHSCISSEFENKFYDWKITALFYVALHYLKALAAKKGIDIGDTHYDIEHAVNPDRTNNKMSIRKGVWREYKALFSYSRTARYEGITDIETFEKLKEVDHSYCLRHLENFKKYIRSQGVDIRIT